MRSATVLLVALACSGSFASEPGQPLDCSDWVFVAPGIGNTSWSMPIAVLNARAAFDSVGHVLRVRPCSGNEPPCAGVCSNGLAIVSSQAGQETVVACLQTRNGSVPGSYDYAAEDVVNPQDNSRSCGTCGVFNSAEGGSCVGFDQTTGRLFLSFLAKPAYPPFDDCHSPNGPSGPYRPVVQRCAIDGFATLNDVLQTYVPAASSIGFRVPYMPEGMAAADHFDSYWGSLTHPLDFTQAHPLQCGFPSTPPHVGDYLTVVDTVPAPAPGQGVYYVTAASYEGARRCGRKTAAGHLSGRDPALLPACVEP